MKLSTVVAALSAGTALAVPANRIVRRQALTDSDILNFALTLEHLEATFYKTGLKLFSQEDFDKAGYFHSFFYRQLKEVASDEATHVTFLEGALKDAGYPAVEPCEYDFSAATDPKTFIEIASILEGVGVSAYLGAAAAITNSDYLTAAGSILTVESRHNAYIRAHLSNSPFPSPFDTPLDPTQVYTMAAQFIKSCPKSSQLPFTAFPTFTAGDSGLVEPGEMVTATLEDAPSGDLYVGWMTVLGPQIVPATASGKTVSFKVPMENVNGQSYAILTSSDKTVTDGNTLAGPATFNVKAAFQ